MTSTTIKIDWSPYHEESGVTLKHIGHTCMSFSLLTSAKVKIWYITMGIHLLMVYEVNPHDFHPTHPLFIKCLYSTIGMKDCVLPEKKIHLPHPSPLSSAPIPLNFSFGNPCLLRNFWSPSISGDGYFFEPGKKEFFYTVWFLLMNGYEFPDWQIC